MVAQGGGRGSSCVGVGVDEGEEGGAAASESAWARGRKPDRASAGRRGRRDGEEREKGRGPAERVQRGWRGRTIQSDGGGERGGGADSVG